MINIPLYPQGSVQMVKKKTTPPKQTKNLTQPKPACSLVYVHSLKYKKVKEIFEENGW